MVAVKRKMLFVDDRSKRLMAALQQFSTYYDVTLATGVKDALRVMASEDFDVVSLDHDLSGCDFEDPDSPTSGMEIIRYIEKTGWPSHKPKPEIYIHSTNLFAGYLMYLRLKALGFRSAQFPFRYVPMVTK